MYIKVAYEDVAPARRYRWEFRERAILGTDVSLVRGVDRLDVDRFIAFAEASYYLVYAGSLLLYKGGVAFMDI